MNAPLDWLPDGLVIRGLDREATIQLAQLMQDAAESGAQAAVQQVSDRQKHDRLCLYGEPGGTSGGLVGRVREVEITVHATRKWGWLVAAALTSAVIGVAAGTVVALVGG